jgi:hypothetical protein
LIQENNSEHIQLMRKGKQELLTARRRGAKMATQAEDDENSQCVVVILRRGTEKSRCGFRIPPHGF